MPDSDVPAIIYPPSEVTAVCKVKSIKEPPKVSCHDISGNCADTVFIKPIDTIQQNRIKRNLFILFFVEEIKEILRMLVIIA